MKYRDCTFMSHSDRSPRREPMSGYRYAALAAVLALLLFILPGCGEELPGHTADCSDAPETVYHSDTSSEDCCLCGGGDLIPFYWGQNNLALVSLNTFDIQPVEINRYDRLTGQLIEEYTGTVSFGGGGNRNGGFSASLLLDCDRGYAVGSVVFRDDAVLDTGKAAAFLCEDHLNEILPQQTDRCFGVGVINLSTKEIRVLEDCLSDFTLGDFYIGCDLTGREAHPRQMDISIFFCPVRYEKEA